MEKLINDLSERTEVASNVVKFLQQSFSEIKYRQQNLDFARESVVERMMEIETIRETYEKGLKDLEEKELDFCTFKEGKKRKFALEEDVLNLKREEHLNDVRMREEKMNKELVCLPEKINSLEVGQNSMHQKLKETEAEENRLDLAWDSLAEKERKINRIVRKMYGEASLLEERENELNSRVERKMRELVSKEEELSLRWKMFIKEVKLADEKFLEKQKLRERLEMAENKLNSLFAVVDKSFKEIEARESAVLVSLAESAKQSDLIGELMEKELEEFEKLKENFLIYQDLKMEELVSKEQGLNIKIEVVIEDAKLSDEQLTKREKLGNQLLERLKLAQDNVEHLKVVVQEKFKQVGLKKVEVESVRDWVDMKMDELDTKGAELERKEDRLISKVIRLKEILKELGLKEVSLRSWEKEVKLKESYISSWEKELRFKQREVDSVEKLTQRRSEELDLKEKSLNSIKKLTSNCFKEHIPIKKQRLLEKDLIKRREKDLDLSDSVDLQSILRMDGKDLQMFLNDPEKDLESMGGEISQVLHLSQDPAKLILDAMVGFYPPHLRKDDVEVDVRRTCINLLEQLSKMTKRIQPSTRKEAIELASSWKSKMGASGEDPLEVLGFLRLLAAYNLASHFDKDEILSFLKSTNQHRQRALRFPVLGFEDSFTDSGVEIESEPGSEEAKT